MYLPLKLLLAAALLLSAGLAQAGATVDAIRARGVLRCGVSTGVAGFSAPDVQGRWQGMDVDYCRALAAAVLGDGDKVQYVPLSSQVRFTALQSGEVDLLARNTTWTLGRDAGLGALFAGVLFYDGQGFLVRSAAKIQSATQLDGATVCLQPGTTTELNLADYARARGIRLKPLLIQDYQQVEKAFFSGRCDAYSADRSALALARSKAPRPQDYTLLPEAISREPLGPMLRRGDVDFFLVARWIINGLLEAEALGVGKANLETQRKSADPAVQRLLGISGELGKSLGLDAAWMARAIAEVGHYGEIYQRNIAPLGIARGENALWRDGGLHYPMPLR